MLKILVPVRATLLLTLFLTLYYLCALNPFLSHDLWHEMALGRVILENRHFPWSDLFSYAPTLPIVVDHEWLSGVLALEIFRLPHGIFILWIGLVLVVIGVLISQLRNIPLSLALLAGIGLRPLLMYTQQTPVLAQAYSVCFAAVFLYFLHNQVEKSVPRLLICAATFIIWVNMHGGMVVAFILVTASLGEKFIKKENYKPLGILLLSMLVLVNLNPYGWHYYTYIYHALLVSKPEIPQWQSDWLWSGNLAFGVPFLLSLGIFLGLTFKRKKLETGAFAILFLAALCIRSHKLLPFYGLAWVFWLGHQNFQEPKISFRISSVIALIALPFFFMIVINKKPWVIQIPGDYAEEGGLKWTQPIGPAQFLKEIGFHGNVMTYFHDGAYLSWELYPAVKVSCDARYEVAFPTKFIDENFKLYLHTPEILAEELRELPGTDAILVPRASKLASRIKDLLSQPAWNLAYEDDAFVLYFRPGLAVHFEDHRGQSIRDYL